MADNPSDCRLVNAEARQLARKCVSEGMEVPLVLNPVYFDPLRDVQLGGETLRLLRERLLIDWFGKGYNAFHSFLGERMAGDSAH